MNILKHRWPTTIDEAKNLQERLSRRVEIVPLKGTFSHVAGVDASFLDERIIATACVYTYPQMILCEQAHAVKKISFPYIPGYLSFREGPSLIEVIRNLMVRPGVIIFDGQGIAHPSGLGLASHIGVLLNIPSIGCAKTRLVGEYSEPGSEKGDRSNLLHKGKKVGTVLRTRRNIKPLFISPGHLIDADSAEKIIMNCVLKYRLPEPVRCADILSKKMKSLI